MTQEIPQTAVENRVKLAQSAFSYFPTSSFGNPWSPEDVDKLEIYSIKEFREVIDACRFFYRRDPIGATVINKMIDIGINDLRFNKNGLSENEFRVFKAIEHDLKEFCETMALEFLLSGLVIPEIKYEPVGKETLKSLGIKKYESLTLPTNMWLRDPKTIKINSTFLTNPSYFLEIPEDIRYFIMHDGRYPDGSKDEKTYEQLKAQYPTFVTSVKNGEKYILLENELIFRRRVVSDSPYPLPYLYPALESMKHKRNLRRMDYSVVSRAISAIMLIKLGSDEFPVTEDDSKVFDDIKSQMTWRDSYGRDIERIFQLFGNHTLNIEWIFPPLDALLNDAKYKDVNQDIIFSLGFPRILITGETERSNTSEAQYASVSPVCTMNNFREKIETVLRSIVSEISKRNGFKSVPEVVFEPLQLAEFKTFVEALMSLYDKGNLSRTELSDFFGYSWIDEMEKKIKEQTVITASKLPEFSVEETNTTPKENTEKLD
jgi:hypothetical protein